MKATNTAQGALRVTRSLAWSEGFNNRMHYYGAHMKIDDHSLTHLHPVGTQDPREKYWWRRGYALWLGTLQRHFYRDNIYEEEQAIKFRHPIPGGHGDRFTHHLAPSPGANYTARVRRDEWERRNLTPEQLAAKYGVYIPRMEAMDLLLGKMLFAMMWTYLILMTYMDDDLAFATHPVLDDFIREIGGVVSITEEDAHLDQWLHPFAHILHTKHQNKHWAFKPMVWVC